MQNTEAYLRIMDLLQNKVQCERCISNYSREHCVRWQDEELLINEAEEFLTRMLNATTSSEGAEPHFFSDFWHEIAQDEKLTALGMKLFVTWYVWTICDLYHYQLDVLVCGIFQQLVGS